MIKLLDMNGNPIKSATAFTSGSTSSKELSAFRPQLQSADRDMLPEKAVTEGRAHDLARNNGFARGAVQNSKDRIVGDRYRLQLNPAYRQLGISIEAASEWAGNVERMFDTFAHDPECFIDARRQSTFTQLLREAVGMDMLHGECLYTREWRGSKLGYSTCFQSVEPERLETPSTASFDANVRGGVKLDSYGAASGYYIRNGHRRDVNMLNLIDEYTLIPKYNDYGWLNVFHVFERERPNQTRGFSPFASVIQKLKMLDRFEDAELSASILAATYAMVLKASPDQSLLEVLGELDTKSSSQLTGTDQFNNGAMTYEALRKLRNDKSDITIDGAKITQLYSGEEIQLLQPNHPNNVFDGFQSAMLRHVARGTNMSYEELSGDFSKTTYSSARAAMQISWQYVKSKRMATPSKLGSLMFRAWLDEAIVKGIVIPPAGVDYWVNRSLLTQCDWVGASRLVIDEVKAANAARVRLELGISTVRDEAFEMGSDYQSLYDQLQIEKAERTARNLPEPTSKGETYQQTFEVANNE